MKRLTKAAQWYFDRYIRQMRKYLKQCESVDASEIENDVYGHVERELEEIPEPVSLNEIYTVLDKLGDPSIWLPLEDMTWWEQLKIKFQVGKKEHPWAYLIFLIFAVLLLGRLGLFFALAVIVIVLTLKRILA